MHRPTRRTTWAVLSLAALLTATTACSDEPERQAAPAASVTPSPSPTPAPTPSASPPPASTSASPTPATSPSASATAAPTMTPGPEEPPDPLSPEPPLETAPPAGQPTCRAADLLVVDADAVISQTAVQELFVVRTTGPDCQLNGYPAVVLRDAAGVALPVTYQRGGFGLAAEQPATVTLSRGTSVSFTVATGRAGTCADAASAVVTLPGAGGPVSAPTALAVCEGSAGLSPVRRQIDVE